MQLIDSQEIISCENKDDTIFFQVNEKRSKEYNYF